MTDDAMLELYEERAAIMEYDGGISRDEAERLAWLEVGSTESELGEEG